jgi:hypothetical protein
MDTQNTTSRERGPVAPMPIDSAYEDSWYRVLKRIADESASDGADAGVDDAGSR